MTHLAWTILDHDEAVLAQRGTLHWIGLRGARALRCCVLVLVIVHAAS